MALDRFVQAQEAVYPVVMAELRAGKKQSHWMWFIFPQLKALGRSGTAQFYGLDDLEEAQAYWAHPVLGPRLRECSSALLQHPGKTAHQILGAPDDLKLCSCMTLFTRAAPGVAVFPAVLDLFYQGVPDPLTLEYLAG